MSTTGIDSSTVDSRRRYDDFADAWQTCTSCPLGDLLVNHRGKKLPGYGDIGSPVLFVAQNPAWNRKGGLVFGGTSQNDVTFIRALERIGVRRDEVFVTNVVKCSTIRNVVPDIDPCSTLWLRRELSILNPALIIAVGRVASLAFPLSTYSGTRARKPIPVVRIAHPGLYLHRRIGERYHEEFTRTITLSIEAAFGRMVR
jgi:uracil-DNA glycosylase family 4